MSHSTTALERIQQASGCALIVDVEEVTVGARQRVVLAALEAILIRIVAQIQVIAVHEIRRLTIVLHLRNPSKECVKSSADLCILRIPTYKPVLELT